MCLEIFNPFLGLPFVWLGLGLFAVIIATLAARSFCVPPTKDPTNHQSSGFTSSCHALPVNRPNNKY